MQGRFSLWTSLLTAGLSALLAAGSAPALAQTAPVAVDNIPARPLGTAVPAAPPLSLPPLAVPETGNTPASPAQQTFDQVAGRLRDDYAGLSAVDRAALIQEYQGRLLAVCQSQALNCPAETAYPVIEAQLTALGDAHTFLQWPDEYQDFVSSAVGGERLQFGFKLAELDGERRLITEVVPGSAADRAGLRRGDVVQRLNGQPYRYDDLTAARVAGRPATLLLDLDRQGRRLSVTLTAARTAAADPPRLSWVGPEKAAHRTAVIRIPTFLSAGEVAARVHEEVGQARARGAGGIVVDLRGNAGGSLLECDLAASAFVPEFRRVAHSAGRETQTRVAGGSRWDDGVLAGRISRPQLWRGPLTVLVDEGSASCAEFFAYEIQRAGAGVVVGAPTSGVGNTATRVFPLTGGAGLQLTVLHYSKPGGQPYPLQVQPDLKVESGEAFLRALAQGRDLALEAGLQALRRQSLAHGTLRPAE
ncbi:S41 family peptidase [Deinococcus sp. Marseille-Q6407]|uniref:S41 family peptidase n=1 Tax=Deinococcus sp. Marseille-Q6407 TaxID=2969223 RepID=UPI0021BEA841|nr:S41 family peptidase [Deinococcus sp. Marseille-Q6407]